MVRTFAMTPMSIIKALSGVNGVAITLDDASIGNYHNKTELIYRTMNQNNNNWKHGGVVYRVSDANKTWCYG